MSHVGSHRSGTINLVTHGTSIHSGSNDGTTMPATVEICSEDNFSDFSIQWNNEVLDLAHMWFDWIRADSVCILNWNWAQYIRAVYSEYLNRLVEEERTGHFPDMSFKDICLLMVNEKGIEFTPEFVESRREVLRDRIRYLEESYKKKWDFEKWEWRK